MQRERLVVFEDGADLLREVVIREGLPANDVRPPVLTDDEGAVVQVQVPPGEELTPAEHAALSGFVREFMRARRVA